MSTSDYRCSTINPKFWDLSSGRRVEEDELEHVTDLSDALELVKKDASTYAYMSYEVRNDPDILTVALAHYPKFTTKFGYKSDLGYGNANPICYAERKAISDRNIDIALQLGNIRFTKLNAISRHKRFVVSCFSTKYPVEELLRELSNISSELKADPDIVQLFHERGKEVKLRSTLDQIGLHTESTMLIMPDGKCIQNQISSNIKTDKKTNPSINSIVKQFKRRLPKDELVYTLLAALAATSEDASICAENGVVVIRVNGDNCLVNLPRPITKEQMDIIVNVVGEELRNKNFYLNLENEAYYEHRGEYMNTDSLDVVDVFRFIRDKGLYVEPYTFQSVPESEQTL